MLENPIYQSGDPRFSHEGLQADIADLECKVKRLEEYSREADRNIGDFIAECHEEWKKRGTGKFARDGDCADALHELMNLVEEDNRCHTELHDAITELNTLREELRGIS